VSSPKSLVVVRLLGASVLGVVLAVFTPLPNRLADYTRAVPRLEAADAIVVLGGSVYPDGTLGCDALHRATQGLVLYRRGLAPLLAFSGAGASGGPVEAEAYSRLARDLQIPPESIVTVRRGRTTHEEAVALAEALRPRRVRRILLVTNSLHLIRAAGTFEKAGFQVAPAPADVASSSVSGAQDRLALLRRVALEVAARAFYRLAGYL